MLFAVSYGRIELVHEVAFGETYRSNVDRPATERAELRGLSDRVQILRVTGFVFFGSANRLLERIRGRVEGATPPRFLVIDLRRVTGVDSSAVVSFVKALSLAEAAGSEVVFTAASDPVRAQLARGGVVEVEGLVSFEPDLDRGLQRCEDALLSAPDLAEALADHPAGRRLDGLPPGLAAHLERVSVPEGTVLLHQDEPPGDIYVLESGRLGVEAVTAEGAGSGSGRSVRGSWSVRSRCTRGALARPTWWPRPRAWSCASAARRSSGSRPRSRSSPRRSTGGSPRRWPSD